MASAVLDLLLPPACAGCGRVGSALCPACVGSFRPPGDPRDRFVAADPGVIVGEAVTLAMASFAYEGALRRALVQLKYGGAARLAEPLASAAAPTVRELLGLARQQALVPVPIHPTRLRERGYNQAALLARSIGRIAGLPVRELIGRMRETTKQHRLDRTARLRNLRQAFVVARGRDPPRSVLLVDDILTTSATLEACAAALIEAGVREVYGFAVAREV